MSFNYFIRLLLKRWMWLFVIPVAAAIYIFMMTNKKPKEYTSSMTLYTGLTSGVSLEQEAANVDYSQALIAYDNLLNVMKSQKTLENVGLRLFCGCMMYGEKDSKWITKTYYDYLLSSVPDDVKKLINKKSEADTYKKCREYMLKNEDNFIFNLINKSGTNFSVGSLSSLAVKRISTSDLVEVTYVANDPGMCYRTLLLVYEETKLNFQALKAGQSDDVVKYFETEMEKLKGNLNSLEDNLVNYSKQNQIVNYEEQSKLVVSQKFGLEDKIDALEMASEAANKAILSLEKQMGVQNRLMLKNDKMTSLRNQIGKLAFEHGARSLFSMDSVKINDAYSKELYALRRKMDAVVDSMTFIRNTEEGVSIDNIISEWLKNVIIYDQAKAQMPIVDKRAKAINAMFDLYSPLGANVKRQEREIGTTEEQYLTVLRGLHSARLKDQNAKMSAGSISLLDPPTYPLGFLPNKSSLRATIAFIALFLLLMVLVIVIEFIDHTMSNVARAERFTGLRVGLLYPLISTKKKKSRIDNLEDIASDYLIVEALRMIKPGIESIQVNLMSIYAQEGKSFLIEKLGAALEKLDSENNTTLRNMIVFKEIPALCDKFADKMDVNEQNVNILVCRANRAWSAVDTRIKDLLIEQTGVKPILLLNGVSIEVLQSQWANLPIKRSKIRQLFKRLLSLELTAKDKF